MPRVESQRDQGHYARAAGRGVGPAVAGLARARPSSRTLAFSLRDFREAPPTWIAPRNTRRRRVAKALTSERGKGTERERERETERERNKERERQSTNRTPDGAESMVKTRRPVPGREGSRD